MVIKMHSRTGSIQQLRHDLCNGPAHVFGEHSKCNPSFCKQTNVSFTCNVGPPQDSDPEDDVSHIDNDPDLIGYLN